MTTRSALKYRFVSYAIKFISSIAFPVAIAKTYGSIVNGDVQLLIAGTSYLSLLDSGMTINALNRRGTRGDSDSHQETAENTLRYQLKSSKQILFIGICIASSLLVFAGWNHVINTELLFSGSLLAAVAILEIAVTPFKYCLYSYGLAGTVEKREAWMSTLSTAALLTWSLLILAGLLPLVVGLPIGLILLRSDRVASGLTSLGDLLTITNSSNDKINLRQTLQAPVVNKNVQGNDGQDRVWISALQILALLNWSIDIFLIKFISGTSAASDYSIYSKFFMIPVTIATLSSPVIQSAVSQGKLKPERFALLANCSWPFMIFMTIAVTEILNHIFATFPFLPRSIGLTTNPSVYLLGSFCFLCILSMVSGFYAPVANGLRLFKYQAIVSAIFLPLNILLSWFLGSYFGFGMVGVIGSTCLAMAITSCLMVPRKIVKHLSHINEIPNYVNSSSSY